MKTICASILAMLLASVLIPVCAADFYAPLPISPAYGSYSSDNTPSLSWYVVAAAENYEIQFSNSSSFSTQDTLTVSDIRDVTVALENPSPDGVYYWRVRMGRLTGEVGPWSTVYFFTIDTVPISAPTLSSPSENAFLKQEDLQFSWTSENSYGYRFLLDNDNDFSSPLHDNLTPSQTATVSGLNAENFFWKVATRDVAGNENYSEVWQFTIDNLLPSINLVSPVPGENLRDNTLLLSWSASDDSGIENFEVTVDGEVVAVLASGVQSLENVELQDGNHSWSVRAWDVGGNENTSSESSFTIDVTPPPAPMKSAPENGTRSVLGNIGFFWVPVLDSKQLVSFYELGVDDSYDFSSPTLLENVEGTSKDIELEDGTHYWRVRAFDNFGNSSDFENSWCLFVDNTPPDAPTTLWPTENVVENTTTPTFSWEPVSDISSVGYEIQVGQDNSFSSLNISDNTSETSYTPTTTLSDDQYYWRVRAIDNMEREGEWSENFGFNVVYRDFAINLTPTQLAVVQGDSAPVTVRVDVLGGYQEYVYLDSSGIPSNVEFSLGGVYPEYISLNHIAVGESAIPDNYVIMITGRDPNDWERTANIYLEILPKPTVVIEAAANENKVLDIGKAGVLQLELVAASNIENAAVYVDTPDNSGMSPPSGTVYSYVQITTENLSSDQLSSVNLKFGVDRSWVRSNNIDTSTITLWRYQSGTWSRLSTKISGGDGLQFHFTASLPGFSIFAVTGEQAAGSPTILVLVPIVVITFLVLIWFLRHRAPEEPVDAPKAGPAPPSPGRAPARPAKPEKPAKKDKEGW
jgi:PGF-pre-PGF domain-containing protein